MYNDVPVLDVHSHLRALTPSSIFFSLLLGTNTAMRMSIVPGSEVPRGRDLFPGMINPVFREAAERHASYIEERNIDVQILGPHPIDVHGWMAPHLFQVWTSYVNDMIFKTCQARPERWVGACQLPQRADLPDTTHVLAELERTVNDYSFVAAYVSPDITGNRDTPGMGESYWYPLYEAAESLGIPLIVHGTSSRDPRFVAVPQNYQLAYTSEQYFAHQFLRHSDVFDRYPRLKIMICHCGGPLDRLHRESALVTPRPDQDLSQNLFFDTCAYDLDYLAAAIKQRGVSQMCFGAEAPGSGTEIRAETGRSADDLVPLIGGHDTLAFLSDADKRAIFHDNPARLCPGLATPLETNAAAKISAY